MAHSIPAGSHGANRTLRPLPDALSLLLLLGVLAPAGITFSRLPMWHGFTTPWPAFLAGAACCGLASMQRRAGWWVLAAAALGVGATLLTLYVLEPGPGFALRDEQVRSRLWIWITSIRDGHEVYDDYAVDVWSTAAAWLAGMWLAWAALRAGWHWLVIGAAGALLAGTIHYLPNWPAGGLAIFAFAALLLVARLHHRALVADAVMRGIARPRRSWRAAGSQVATIAGGAGALVLAAWALPAAHWRAPELVHTTARSITRPGSVAISTAHQLKVLHDFGAVLPFSGAVSLGDGVVATVDGPGPGYLFGMSYDRYSSDGWQTSASERPRQQAPLLSDATGGISHPEPVGARLTDGPAYQDSQPLDVTVHLEIASSVLLAAGPPVGVPAAQVNGTHGLQFAPQAIKGAPAGEYAALLAAGGLPAGGSYTSSGLISKAAESGLRSVTAATPEWVRSTYLQLPGTVPDRVRAKAAEVTARATTDYDRALAVQSYLRSFPYDESIAAPPAGEDGVDYLLFVARRGYCDYFASAMAVMLRSVGIPARIVVGYVMHDGTGTGPYQVHERDAHAWTEVFFAGYGWQRFDPTPGGANPSPGAARDTQAATAIQPALPTPAVAAQDQVPPILSDPSKHAAGTPAHAGPSAALVALWTSLFAFLALTSVYLWARLRGNPRAAAIAAWRSASLAGRLTTRARRPHETAHEYTTMLIREHDRAAGLQDVATAYARAQFGPGKPSRPFPRLWRRLGSGISGLVIGRLGRSKGDRRTP